MLGWETAVREALRQPDMILYDKAFSARECFYRLGTPLSSGKYLKVVVEFDDDGQGVVVTAFPTRNPLSGERHKWP